jgi:hypothetical protein
MRTFEELQEAHKSVSHQRNPTAWPVLARHTKEAFKYREREKNLEGSQR